MSGPLTPEEESRIRQYVWESRLANGEPDGVEPWWFIAERLLATLDTARAAAPSVPGPRAQWDSSGDEVRSYAASPEPTPGLREDQERLLAWIGDASIAGVRIADEVRAALAARLEWVARPDAAKLTDAIAYAIARAPVPGKSDTARSVAARLAPLVLESGYLAGAPDDREGQK